jgi:hypothetical protein
MGLVPCAEQLALAEGAQAAYGSELGAAAVRIRQGGKPSTARQISGDLPKRREIQPMMSSSRVIFKIISSRPGCWLASCS